MDIKKLVVSMILIVGTLNTNCMEEPSAKRLRTEIPEQESINQALFDAVREGNLEKAQKLLEKGASVHATDQSHTTPLYLAVLNGHINIIELLLEYGADMNAIAPNGLTPWILAFTHNKVIELLVGKGANVNAVSEDGESLMHYVSKNGEPTMVSFLLEHGANLNVRSKCGHTPLWLAVHSNNEETALLLLRNNADCNIADTEGNTPLHKASYFSPAIIKLLIEHGADLNARNNEGCSILDSFIHEVENLDPTEIDITVMSAKAKILLKGKAQLNLFDQEKLQHALDKITTDILLDNALNNGHLLSVQKVIEPLKPEEKAYWLNATLINAVRQREPKLELITYLLGTGASTIAKALNEDDEMDQPEQPIAAQLIRRLPLVDQIARNEKLRAPLIKGLLRLPRDVVEKILKHNPMQAVNIALSHGMVEVLSLILEMRPQFWPRNGVGEYYKEDLLKRAALHENIEIAKKLVKFLLELEFSPLELRFSRRRFSPSPTLLNELTSAEDSDKRKPIIELIAEHTRT
jgi:ankyrin repeat protein